MPATISENLPVILIATAIILALLWWLVSGRSSDETKDIPATSTPLDSLEKAAVDPAPTVKEKSKEPVAASPGAPPAKKTAARPKPASPEIATPKPAPTKASAAVKTPAAKKDAAPKVRVTAAPVTATPKPAAKAKPQPATATKPKPVAVPDNVGLLKGVGPKLTTLLQSLGVTNFAQIAGWTDADIIEIDSKLGNFAGRITRDNWVDQAKLLSSGDIAGFEKKYGALGEGKKLNLKFT